MSAPAGRRTVVGLLFAAVLLDGLDAVALPLVVPGLAPRWGVDPAAFTIPIVLTNVGLLLGYTSSGPLSARIGAKRALLVGVVAFALGSLLNVVAVGLYSMVLLGVIRTVTGIGLGIVLPAAIALATTSATGRSRTLASVGVTLGLAAGGTLAAVAAGVLVPRFGPASLFWVGGVLPLLLAPALVRFVPDVTVARPSTPEDRRAEVGVGRLWRADVRRSTALLWPFAFLVFAAASTLQSWLPTMLVEYGLDPVRAALGIAWFGVGGILGGVALLPLAARFGLIRSLVAYAAVGVVALVVAALFAPVGPVLMLVFGFSGVALVSCQIGQLALAVDLYPAATVATGVGWAATSGRVGSMVAPAVAGGLLAAATPARTVVLLIGVPVAAACLVAVAIWREQTRRRGTDDVVPPGSGDPLPERRSEPA